MAATISARLASRQRRVPQASERAGDWNQIDIVFQSGRAQHFLNGELVAGGADFRLEWPGLPVTSLQRGKLQIQSEGGEIYYRHIELLPLR